MLMRASRARRSTGEKEGEGLFAVDVAVGILLGISVCAGNAQLREGGAVEVIVGLAVPGTVGGDDSRQQAGSDTVGARHQGLWFGFGDILVRTADGRGKNEAEGAGQQQSRTQRLTLLNLMTPLYYLRSTRKET